jgi:hypothetical protein
MFFLILKLAYQYKQDEIGIHKLDCSLLVAIEIWIVDFFMNDNACSHHQWFLFFGEISQPGDKKKALATNTKDLLGEKMSHCSHIMVEKNGPLSSHYGEKKLKLPDLDNKL